MGSVISKNAAIRKVTALIDRARIVVWDEHAFKTVECFLTIAAEKIQDMPAAPAPIEPKTIVIEKDRASGYWLLLDECANAGVYCSVCTKKVYKESYANQKLQSPYCPNCGARMDGDPK